MPSDVPNLPETPAEPKKAPVQSAGRRAGGLVAGPKGQVNPLFTVTLTMVYLELFALVFFPYIIARDSGTYWGTNAWFSFAALTVLTSTAFGIFSAVVSERRGRSAWWYLAGQAGVVLGPVLASQGLAEAEPRLALLGVVGAGILGAMFALLSLPSSEDPRAKEIPPTPPLLQRLGAFWYRSGNIWLGLSLLAALMIALGFGVRWEDMYGTKSAHHNVYGNWWFGVLFLSFSASLISATVRKYPWRVDQTGWLVVHVALTTLIVGAFLTFWGKVEGNLTLPEGSKDSHFLLSTDSEFVVEEWVRKPAGEGGMWEEVWQTEIEADVDPKETEPSESHAVRIAGKKVFGFTIDRYFAQAKQADPEFDFNSPKPNAAIRVAVTPPQSEKPITAILVSDGQNNTRSLGNMLQLVMMRTTSPRRIEAIYGGRDSDLLQRGNLVVRERGGLVLARIPVRLRRDSAAGSFVPTEAMQSIRIEERGLTLRMERWFDLFQFSRTGGPTDASPGIPFKPAAKLTITHDDGRSEGRLLEAFEKIAGLNLEEEREFSDLEIDLDYIPPMPMGAGTLIFAKLEGGGLHWAMERTDGTRLHGEVEANEELPLGLPIAVEVTNQWSNYRSWPSFEFANHQPGTAESLRVQLEDGAEADWPYQWLLVNSDRARFSQPIRADGRVFRLGWRRPRAPLGFELELREFHRDFYPGSRQASSFESYLYLRHPEKFREPTGIKIDMNNPLRLDGWRLFQARFNSGPGGAEVTILQVNRDPGLGLTYIACALLSLGMVIVFFQKPFMRAWQRRLKASQASGGAMLCAGLTVVTGTFLAVLPGILIIATTPEGPMLGIAVIAIVLGLVLETVLVNTLVKRRLESKATRSSAQSPVGATS